ncbi:OLC1v1001643C1 [Oldenlandia corymbosa var. corymbosa]|uniref:OLC1v1001643C1 n=1 Tax=Oldenlandia corymbosa var. corymbosa TaxID=529605 RepID=A0AAV1D965_OLDCO|nr:OLC1v1001643C1 [Oldenlandia corymbosa var. corymbosa]
MRRYDDSDKEEDDDGGSYYQTPKEQSDDEDDEETNRRETLRRVARNIQYGYDNYLPQCNEYPGEEHLLDAPLKNWRYLFPTEEEVARRNSMRRAARIMQDGYDNYLPKYNEYPGEDLSGPFNKKFHLHLHDHDDDDD